MISHCRAILVSTSVLFLVSCSNYFSHVNVPAQDKERSILQNSVEQVPSGASVASENVPWNIDPDCRNSTRVSIDENIQQTRARCETNDENLVAIAISGGGSRSAVFSAQVLFELQRYGILQRVDVISSVSGGSYTAAFYALSCDPEQVSEGGISKDNCPDTVEDPDRFRWREDVVFHELKKDFQVRWFLNLFYPDNIVRYWTTAYDRTDIMAETLSDNLFDNSYFGNEGFRFHDLNPQRPNLIINATNNTLVDRWYCPSRPRDHLYFTFTQETFKCLNSNLGKYPIANAVTASAAFPFVFNYLTLGIYPSPDAGSEANRYVHLIDGGPADNLGLEPLKEIVKANKGAGRPKEKIVILIDADTPSSKKNSADPDPRNAISYFIDTNGIDSVGILFESKRKRSIRNFKELPGIRFIHYRFGDVKSVDRTVYNRVVNIGTWLAINDNDAACLRRAARIVVNKTKGLLMDLRNKLYKKHPPIVQQPGELPVCLEQVNDDRESVSGQ